MTWPCRRARNQDYRFLHKLAATLVALAVAIILIAPQVDLDDTTLQSGAMLTMGFTSVATRGQMLVELQPRAAVQEVGGCPAAITDLNCVRLL